MKKMDLFSLKPVSMAKKPFVLPLDYRDLLQYKSIKVGH